MIIATNHLIYISTLQVAATVDLKYWIGIIANVINVESNVIPANVCVQ